MTGSPPMAVDWRAAPGDVAPTVLVLGGFLTSPPLYARMRTRLLERGAAHVEIASIWGPDWLLATWRGVGPLLTRSGRALLAAGRATVASPRSRGAPLLVVGHSAGGLVARLLTSPEPFAGRRLGAASRMAAIVTLGTPHRVTPGGLAGRRLARAATDFADRVVPGAAFAPTTGYLTVTSRFQVGRQAGGPPEQALYRVYRSLLAAGDPATGVGDRGAIVGDGLVPVASAALPGVEAIVLDGIGHGQARFAPWYGSDEALDVWWPRAVDVWRTALRARIDAGRS